MPVNTNLQNGNVLYAQNLISAFANAVTILGGDNIQGNLAIQGTDLLSSITYSTNTANIAVNTANIAIIQSNLALSQLNASFSSANTALSQSNTSLSQSNLALTQMNATFAVANTANNSATFAVTQAQLAYNLANTSTSNSGAAQAQFAFNQANSAMNVANFGSTTANNALPKTGGTVTGTTTFSASVTGLAVSNNMSLGTSGQSTTVLNASSTNTLVIFVGSGGSSGLLQSDAQLRAPSLLLVPNTTITTTSPQLIWENANFSGTYNPNLAWNVNLMQVTDNVAANSGGAVLQIAQNYGANSTGPRNALIVTQNQTANTPGVNGASTLQAYNFANFGSGGTSFTSGESGLGGTTWALNTVTTIGANNQFAAGIVGYELDISAQLGSSVYDKFGIIIVQLNNDAAQGYRDDMALGFGNQFGNNVPGWNKLISVGTSAGNPPLSSNGWVLSFTPHYQSITNYVPGAGGIDFSLFKPNVAYIRANTFSIDANGYFYSNQITANNNLTIGNSTNNQLTISPGINNTSPISFTQSGTGGIQFPGGLTINSSGDITLNGGQYVSSDILSSTTSSNTQSFKCGSAGPVMMVLDPINNIVQPKKTLNLGTSGVWSGTAVNGNAALVHQLNWTGTSTRTDYTAFNFYQMFDAVVNSGGGHSAGIWLTHNLNSNTKTGGASALVVSMNISSNTANPLGAIYSGISSTVNVTSGDNGTANSFATSYTAMNPVLTLSNTALYTSGGSGMEIDIGFATSATDKLGLLIDLLSIDTVKAVRDNIAIAMDAQGTSTSKWTYGISFGRSGGQFPFDSNSTFLYAQGHNGAAVSCGRGIDFTNVTFSDSSFKANGFTISGTGNTIISGSKINIINIPTSNVGLSAGDIYSNNGILCINP